MPCFNPVLGFYCPATSDVPGIFSSGFLLSRRRFQSRCFNPVLGFYCPATTLRIPRTVDGARVSIPFWVSTVLRPSEATDVDTNPFWVSTVLNPFWVSMSRRLARQDGFVSILFWVSTVPATGVIPMNSRDDARRFNPVLGFYCPATVARVFTVLRYSRVRVSILLGFLLSCDGRRRHDPPSFCG